MASIDPHKKDFDVIVIGGGLAGLTSAILLSQRGKKVLVIEKKDYPQHRVCGEYISNEVLDFLRHIGFDPYSYGAMPIRRLRISTPAGKNIYSPLDLGAFGLSRYVMDHALYKLAIQKGAVIITKTKAMEVQLRDDLFAVKTNNGDVFTAAIVISSHGKRDTLDKQLKRDFMQEQTGYLGVKYHIRTDYPIDEIGLDNFADGYCGISRVEDGKYNLCYLYHRSKQARYKTIPDIESHVLFKNPMLRNIFTHSDFLFPKPEVINDFSFAPKSLAEGNILMCGDSAGLITPLCGNGMSMAIHAAKILSELILKSGLLDVGKIAIAQRQQLEVAYSREWKKNFSTRLFWGRNLQKAFGNATITGAVINSIHAVPPLERWLISKTHGSAIAP